MIVVGGYGEHGNLRSLEILDYGATEWQKDPDLSFLFLIHNRFKVRILRMDMCTDTHADTLMNTRG